MFIFDEMVGQFNRDNLILKAKNNKYYAKHDFFNPDGVYKKYLNEKPRIHYESSVLELSPKSKALIISDVKTNSDTNGKSGNVSYYNNAESIVHDFDHLKTAVSIAPTVVKKGAEIAQKVLPMITEATSDTAHAAQVASAASTASGIASTAESVAESAGKVIGPAANVAGGVLSGIGLGFNIADAVKEKKENGKVSFDTAMNIADNATGVVAAAANFIPVVGTGISIALSVGEKVVTSAIRAGKAVAEEKKREGVKHLKPADWLKITIDAIFPHWMTTDFKTLWEEHKAKKEADKAELQRETEIMKRAITDGKKAIIANKIKRRPVNAQHLRKINQRRIDRHRRKK
jgi:hypothetical protein